MGKNPAGSVIIATRANFSALLAILHFFKDDVDASNEVLRCIANALLLIETGRNVLISKDVGGGSAMVELLEVSTYTHPSSFEFIVIAENYVSGAHISGLPYTIPGNSLRGIRERIHPSSR